jgi:hypothetical protein
VLGTAGRTALEEVSGPALAIDVADVGLLTTAPSPPAPVAASEVAAVDGTAAGAVADDVAAIDDDVEAPGAVGRADGPGTRAPGSLDGLVVGADPAGPPAASGTAWVAPGSDSGASRRADVTGVARST